MHLTPLLVVFMEIPIHHLDKLTTSIYLPPYLLRTSLFFCFAPACHLVHKVLWYRLYSSVIKFSFRSSTSRILIQYVPWPNERKKASATNANARNHTIFRTGPNRLQKQTHHFASPLYKAVELCFSVGSEQLADLLDELGWTTSDKGLRGDIFSD